MSDEDASGYDSWVGANWEQDAADVIEIIKGCDEGGSKKLLVVDHYGLDSRWEKKLRSHVNYIMVIDDLANRPHDCDFLLDQNLYENMNERYRGLVSEHCRLFLGPEYALIRKEFREAKKKMKPRTGEVKRILIFMGGTDPTNETTKALKAVMMLGRLEIAVDVVVGAQNPHRHQIEEMCRQMPNTRFHLQTDRMAELMAEADLAIGGGGTTTWERCFMELPSLVVSVAKNQKAAAEYLRRTGAIEFLGVNEGVDPNVIKNVLELYATAPQLVTRMAKQCMTVGVGRDHVAVMILGKICFA